MTLSKAVTGRTPFLSYENLVLLLMVLVAGIAAADRLSFNILSPLIMAEFGVSNAEIGLLTSAFSIMMAGSALGIGWLCRLQGNNHKRLLIIAVVAFSVSAMLGGLATSFAALVFVRLAMGLTEGPVFPFAQTILVQESSPHRRAFNNSMTQTFGGMLVGAFIAPMLLGVLAESFGWRAALVIIGAPGLVLALLLAVLLKQRAPQDPVVSAHVAPIIDQVIPAGAERNVRLCVLVGMGMISWLILQGIFVPLYLMNARGYAVGEMTQVMAMSGLGGLLGAVVISILADRFGRKPAMILAALLACVSPLSAIYLSDSMGLLMAGTLIGWLGAGACGLFMATIPAESVPSARHPQVMGLVLAVPEVFAGVLMPVVVGLGADHFGLGLPLWICLAGAVFALLGALCLQETRAQR